MNDQDFIAEMKLFALDHLPDGYPAVQTQHIDRLIDIIERQQARIAELQNSQ